MEDGAGSVGVEGTASVEPAFRRAGRADGDVVRMLPFSGQNRAGLDMLILRPG
ncbi:hypothetical protein ACFDC8_00505 [Escherichia coli]